MAKNMDEVVSVSETEVGLLSERRRAQVSKVIGAAAIVFAALLVTVAAVRFVPASLGSTPSAPADAVIQYEDGQIEVVPPREKCTKIGQSCKQTKCCRFSGYQCYEQNDNWASCLKECIPGQPNGDKETNFPKVQDTPPPEAGPVPAKAEPFFAPAPPGYWSCARDELRIMKPALSPPGTKLFCFTVFLLDNGGGKKIYELDIVRTQLHVGASIFGCEDWTVFSEVRTWLSPGPPANIWTVKLDYPKIARRPNTKLWVNTPLFVNAWNAIKAEGKYLLQDWTVKVDATTVFFPSRLRTLLITQKVTANGVYLENCKHVRYGFFGGIEVISKKAAQVLAENAAGCLSELPWDHALHSHFRYAGEDKFAQRCMDRHGVDKVPSTYEAGKTPSNLGLFSSVACPSHIPKEEKKVKKWKPNCATVKTAALHQFKKPEEYFKCLLDAQK